MLPTHAHQIRLLNFVSSSQERSGAVQQFRKSIVFEICICERVALGVSEFGYSESVITPLIFFIFVNEISPSFRPWT